MIVTGAMGEYLAHRDVDVNTTPFRVGMPISLRSQGDDSEGNQISFKLLELPIAETRLDKQLALIREQTGNLNRNQPGAVPAMDRPESLLAICGNTTQLHLLRRSLVDLMADRDPDSDGEASANLIEQTIAWMGDSAAVQYRDGTMDSSARLSHVRRSTRLGLRRTGVPTAPNADGEADQKNSKSS